MAELQDEVLIKVDILWFDFAIENLFLTFNINILIWNLQCYMLFFRLFPGSIKHALKILGLQISDNDVMSDRETISQYSSREKVIDDITPHEGSQLNVT